MGWTTCMLGWFDPWTWSFYCVSCRWTRYVVTCGCGDVVVGFLTVDQEGAIVSMTPLGSSPGGEVFYVSSEEWVSQAAQAAGGLLGLWSLAAGWLQRWPADCKQLSWSQTHGTELMVVRSTCPLPESTFHNMFEVMQCDATAEWCRQGVHNQRTMPCGHAAISDHCRRFLTFHFDLELVDFQTTLQNMNWPALTGEAFVMFCFWNNGSEHGVYPQLWPFE